MLPKLLNAGNPNSLNQNFRKKRFSLLKQMIDVLDKPITILDIGGTYNYWKNMSFDPTDIKIVLVNLHLEKVDHPSFTSVTGDATNLKEYADQSFDIVFSNSVIEHLYSFENQKKMAKEIQRVGTSYYVQTPNKFFPIEPHWLFPFFQFLPKQVRILLTKNFNMGNYKKAKTYAAAKNKVEEVRLLTKKEMRSIFPGAVLWKEKFFGLTKSYVALKQPSLK